MTLAPRNAPAGSRYDAATDEEVDAAYAASRALVALSARSIAGAKGVTLPQYRMLVVLDQAPSNLTALARNLDVTPSTAMRMIDRLEIAGFVLRSVSPESRRESRLSLTAAGRRVVRTVTERRRRDLRTVLSELDPAARAELLRSMTLLADTVDRVLD